ncbi:MAG: HDOD domain-containing protein [Motiliproteus sp.]
MESSLAPQGLEHWVDLLRDKLLPVPAQTLGLLRQQLQDPQVSLQQIQPIIGRDPVLTMHCISLANRLNRNPDTDVSTIELAVSTLGLTRIVELTGKLPAIRLNYASVPHKQYFHALADSYHAATQAAALCRYKDRALINNTRTAALFYAVGHWALWRYAPQQMSQIKIRVYEQQQDTALAEYEILGCTVQQLSEQLVELWSLSQLAGEALQHQTSPDAELLQQVHLQAEHSQTLTELQKRNAKQLINTLAYPVKLANWLALTATLGWTHPKTLQIIGFISDFRQTSVDETTAKLHQQCVQSSHQHPLPGLLSPAALLLLLPSELVLNYRIDTKDLGTDPTKNILTSVISPKKLLSIKLLTSSLTSTPATTAAQDGPPDPLAATFRDEAIFHQTLQQLLSPSTQINTLRQVLALLKRGLVPGLGLERLICFTIDTAMQLSPVSDPDSATDLSHFTLNLNIPSLFKKMSQKQLAVWVHSDNRARIWTELPEPFKALCHPQSFALISLFEGNQPALMLYADRHPQDLAISAFQFQKFKQLAVAANRCILQLATNSNKDVR